MDIGLPKCTHSVYSQTNWTTSWIIQRNKKKIYIISERERESSLRAADVFQSFGGQMWGPRMLYSRQPVQVADSSPLNDMWSPSHATLSHSLANRHSEHTHHTCTRTCTHTHTCASPSGHRAQRTLRALLRTEPLLRTDIAEPPEGRGHTRWVGKLQHPDTHTLWDSGEEGVTEREGVTVGVWASVCVGSEERRGETMCRVGEYGVDVWIANISAGFARKGDDAFFLFVVILLIAYLLDLLSACKY